MNTNQVIHKTLIKTSMCVLVLLSLRNLNRRCPLKFVHSSFHGVGHDYVQKAFQTFGFAPPIPVPEQKDPDPNFSSVICPNPEEGLTVLVGHRLVCQDLKLRVSLFVSVTLIILLSSRNFLSFWQRKKMLQLSWQQILMLTAWR